MAKESKYYYITEIPIGFKTNREPRLVKWNENYEVEIDENVDHHQYISIGIDKLSEKNTLKPESNSYEKVKPILNEIFLDHYSLAIKLINEMHISPNGEFYLLRRNKDWFQIEYFSDEKNKKQKILIDFRDGIDFLTLMLDSSPDYRGRPGMRKDGAPIKMELFKQLLNLTLKFLYDSDSYKAFLDPYLKDFYGLVSGNSKIENFIFTEGKAFNNVLEQLEARKKTIERRLIEVDKDTEFDRVRLRGEIDGIIFAISTIKLNQ